MANSQTDPNQTDRLSNLPDELLVVILSFLPTHIAARTSVLSHRFRHLWETSPSLELLSWSVPRPPSKNFVAMAKRVLLRRNPSHPLLRLRIEAYHCGEISRAMVSSLLAKARSLDLRHLTVLTLDGFQLSDFLPILPIIFTINSLRCLSLGISGATPYDREELKFPSGINLSCLRSLSINMSGTDLANLNPLISELCSLEDLYLYIRGTPGLSLSSQTIRKLKLIITSKTEKLDIVGLSLPSLESLHLEIPFSHQNLSHIHAQVPLLRKAVIKLYELHERNVSAVAGLLNCISHVEDLSLNLGESLVIHFTPLNYYVFVHVSYVFFCTSGDLQSPIPILSESGKDVPQFSNLKHLDLTLCFHEHNFEAVTMMLHNCPVLNSLKLVHMSPYFTGSVRGQKRKDCRSKLPHNADGNYQYAYFRNLHLGEDRKEFMKLLSKKCKSKRQARN